MPLSKAQLDLLGSSGFCFTQNIGIDVSGDVHVYFYNNQHFPLKTKLTPLELRSQFVA